MSLYEKFCNTYNFEKTVHDTEKVVIKDFPDDMLLKVGEATGFDCYIKTKQILSQISIYKNDNCITMYITASDKVEINQRGNWLVAGKTIGFIIFKDSDTIYVDTKINSVFKSDRRFIPLTIKEFFRLSEKYPVVKDLLSIILEHFANKSSFSADVFRTFQSDGVVLLPLEFSEMPQYHNPSDYFERKYKNSTNIPCNWNKKTLNASYLIIKSKSKVREIDLPLLYKVNKIPDLFFRYEISYKVNYLIKIFLTSIIYDRINKPEDIPEEEVYDQIYDYVNICLLSKEKVRLSFKSYRKLVEAHNIISESNYRKKTPKVTIRKNSRFLDLRRILPPEFEWIKTKKRLIEETIMQHHCVWSYASDINKDMCQIYSYVDKNETRFTLEFKYNGGKYYLAQIQGKFNKGDTTEVKEYVNKLLSARVA